MDRSDNSDFLLKAVKQEVKRLMEEIVTKKFIHESSPTITQLCVAIDSCLLDGLKSQFSAPVQSTETSSRERDSIVPQAASPSIYLLRTLASSAHPAKPILDSKSARSSRVSRAPARHSFNDGPDAALRVWLALLRRWGLDADSLENYGLECRNRGSSGDNRKNELMSSWQLSLPALLPFGHSDRSAESSGAESVGAGGGGAKDRSRRHTAERAASTDSSSSGSSRTLAMLDSTSAAVTQTRFEWLRVALCDVRVLHTIVEHLVSNATTYYEKGALLIDPIAGPILAALLVGPSSLEYSRLRHCEQQFWSDPPADELLLRRRIRAPDASDSPSSMSGSLSTSQAGSSSSAALACSYFASAARHQRIFVRSLSHAAGDSSTLVRLQRNRPSLELRKKRIGSANSTSSDFAGGGGGGSVCETPIAPEARLAEPAANPKEFIEALHQNARTTQLYGKNNVFVQNENGDPLGGYFGLHETPEGLVVQWVPNELMNAQSADGNFPGRCDAEGQLWTPPPPDASAALLEADAQRASGSARLKNDTFWDYALAIKLRQIVYLHCHKNHEGENMILVALDGVQHPAFRFPRGGHLLAFLSCLESGLLAIGGALEPTLFASDTDSHSVQSAPTTRPTSSSLEPEEPRHPERNGSASNGVASTDSSSRASDADAHRADYLYRIIHPQVACTDSQEGVQRSEWPQRAENASSLPLPLALPGGMSAPLANGSLKCASLSARYPAPSSEITPWDSIRTLCASMRNQILSRAFRGWLEFVRERRTVRTQIAPLLLRAPLVCAADQSAWLNTTAPLTRDAWNAMLSPDGKMLQRDTFYKAVYFGGIEQQMRRELWPFLLHHYELESTANERREIDRQMRRIYEEAMTEWLAVEAVVKQREQEFQQLLILRNRIHELSDNLKQLDVDSETASKSKRGEVQAARDELEKRKRELKRELVDMNVREVMDHTRNQLASPPAETSTVSSAGGSLMCIASATATAAAAQLAVHSVPPPGNNTPAQQQLAVAAASASSGTSTAVGDGTALSDASGVRVYVSPSATEADSLKKTADEETHVPSDSDASPSHATSTKASGLLANPLQFAASSRSSSAGTPGSPANSVRGGVYAPELLDLLAVQFQRIDKDVQRCDRTYSYFADLKNLEKLRNIMCTYVWQNLELGYIQGMCDLAAPLLVIFEEEWLTYSCFNNQMKRLLPNFPPATEIDKHFAHTGALTQIMDPDLFELMNKNGNYATYYFAYRWFLLDFKRELRYDDVFVAWESIWAAEVVTSRCFVDFISLALVELYREVIIDNNMDLMDCMRFFNETAEKHVFSEVLRIARHLLLRAQLLVDDKADEDEE